MEEIIKHIYDSYYKHIYQQKMSDIKKNYEKDINKTLYINIEKNLINLIQQNSWKHLILEYREKYEESIKSTKSDQLINTYIKNYLKSLSDSSPLIQQLNNRVSFYLDYVYEIIKNFHYDKADLSSFLEVGELRNIQIEMGDSHNKGKTVAIIHLETDDKILYKPKSLKPDLFYFEILDFYDEFLKFKPYIPFIIDRETYGWQEYIENEPVKCQKEIEDYYYDLGIQSQVLYFLNASDMHYENIISKGKNPVFIDLETILQPSIQKMELSDTSYPFLESILHTLLFDYSNHNDDIRFLGGTTNQSYTDNIVSTTIHRNNDAINVIEEISNEEKKSMNIPQDKNGNYHEIYNGIDSFLAGFSDSYNITIGNKLHLVNLIDQMNLNVRSVLRPTYVYAKYIEFFKQLESEDGIFELLADSIKGYKNNEDIANIELINLLNLDVPTFQVNIHSKTLYSAQGDIIIQSFFEESSLEKVSKKIRSANIEDMKKQCKIMKNSIAAYRENIDNSNNYSIRKRREITTLKHEMNSLKEEILSPHLLNLKYDSFGNAIFAPITYDLYYGLSGIILTLLEYNQCNPSFLNLDVINKFNKKIFNLYKLDYENNFSVYHGRFSYFKYIYLINKYFQYNVAFSEELELLLNDYINYLNEEKNAPLDYLGGISGVLSLLVDFYEYYDLDFLNKYIIELKSILLERFDLKNYTIGLAHGLSGIALALTKCNNIIKDSNISFVVNNILIKENKIYFIEKEKIPVVWCNGISGMVLARNKIRGKSEKSPSLLLKTLEKQLKSNYLLSGNSQSVCHGSHGNSLILKALNNDFNDSKEIFATLEFEWTSGFEYPNENYSLFLGKTGQLLNLIHPNHMLINDLLI